MSETRWTRFEGATLAVLVALAGTTLTGYRFGDSNHGITIPILKRLMDPSLYPGDIMVATAERFPTVFYRLLASVLPGRDAIAPVFFGLYVVSIAATLAGAWRLGSFFGGPVAGHLALAIAFPVKIGLAGEALYRVAFSHSHLASALTIWAIVWFLEGRRALPLLVLSIGAYNHLLYSAYALLPLGLVLWLEAKRVGTRVALWRLGLAVVPLLPLAVSLLSHSTPMTSEWLELLRERSAHHSFPGAFGEDLPDAAALLAMTVLGCSGLSPEKRRLLGAFMVATALFFVAGTLFTEYWPVKAVLQFQPHRSWRFLQLLLQGVVAASLVTGFRAGGAARISAALTFLVVALPGLESALPLAVLSQALLAPGREPWALAVSAGVLCGVEGWGHRELSFEFLPELFRRSLNLVPLRAAGLALLVLLGLGLPRWRRPLAALSALLAVLWLAPFAYRAVEPRWSSGTWREVQQWARTHTPKDAVFLTPPQEAGFRVFSERTIVGEWKDGTQQYFDDQFVREWSQRMQALGGDRFSRLDDDALLQLAARFRARYIVLGESQERSGLARVFELGSISVYEARRP